MTDVYVRETGEGWIIETADEFRDTLAGPFETEKLLKIAVKELDCRVLSTQVNSANITVRKKVFRVRDRKPEDVFRIDGYWYRLKSVDGKKSNVDVVGENRSVELDSNETITEVSVTTLQ